MKKITFSHDYQKLIWARQPYQAQLLAVFNTTKKDMGTAFIEYDTAFVDLDEEGYALNHYKLPSGPLLVLLFQAMKGPIFTTIRSNRKHPYDKEQYYRDAIGEVFHVVTEEKA